MTNSSPIMDKTYNYFSSLRLCVFHFTFIQKHLKKLPLRSYDPHQARTVPYHTAGIGPHNRDVTCDDNDDDAEESKTKHEGVCTLTYHSCGQGRRFDRGLLSMIFLC
mmetsp:Transcript_10976/g.21717  ORF Transcript_10976/g.21717 Transcript_10976/m.21717 type:complete len:107 (+) Transcript_10976:1473-1793(+)